MKLRYIIIPLCIILYIWWSFVAITNWRQSFQFSYVGVSSTIYFLVHFAVLFCAIMFLIAWLFDYCEKHW